MFKHIQDHEAELRARMRAIYALSQHQYIEKSGAALAAPLFEMGENQQLEKAGEGSRGGKVVGHTSSGKPIYDSFNHPSHKNFTKQDHKDASEHHNRLADRADSGRSDYGGPSGTATSHYKKSHLHAAAAGEDVDSGNEHGEAFMKKVEAARQLSKLNKSNEENLEKGGEGSRGGRVIGHTKSGSPIYDTTSQKSKTEHPLHKKLDSFLNKFPDNATSWSQATDEVRDLARSAREHHNEYDLNVSEDDSKAAQSLNWREMKTPAEWNSKGKKFIKEMVGKMGKEAKDAFMKRHSEWLEKAQANELNFQTPLEHQQLLKAQIANIYNGDQLGEMQAEILEKGKKAVIGEKRTFGDKEYIKTANGWRPVGKNGGKIKEAHDAIHGEKYSHDKHLSKIVDQLTSDKRRRGFSISDIHEAGEKVGVKTQALSDHDYDVIKLSAIKRANPASIDTYHEGRMDKHWSSKALEMVFGSGSMKTGVDGESENSKVDEQVINQFLNEYSDSEGESDTLTYKDLKYRVLATEDGGHKYFVVDNIGDVEGEDIDADMSVGVSSWTLPLSTKYKVNAKKLTKLLDKISNHVKG